MFWALLSIYLPKCSALGISFSRPSANALPRCRMCIEDRSTSIKVRLATCICLLLLIFPKQVAGPILRYASIIRDLKRVSGPAVLSRNVVEG